MAIVNSSAIGTASKSAGNLVYQHYYGRTIARHKPLNGITTQPTANQITCRNLFSFCVYVANLAKNYLDRVFTRATYGTKYSNFMSVNHAAMAEIYRVWPTKYAYNMWDYLYMLYQAREKYMQDLFRQMYYTSYGRQGETFVSTTNIGGDGNWKLNTQCDMQEKYTKCEIWIYYATLSDVVGHIHHEEAVQDENNSCAISFVTDVDYHESIMMMGVCVADGIPVNGIYAIGGHIV